MERVGRVVVSFTFINEPETGNIEPSRRFAALAIFRPKGSVAGLW